MGVFKGERKYIAVILVLIVGLIVSINYITRISILNDKYESYLSQELSNHVAGFADGTISAKNLIARVINEKELYYDDLLELGSNFNFIWANLQEMSLMNVHLKAVNLSGNNFFIEANHSIEEYFNRGLKARFSDDPERVKLDNKESIRLKYYDIDLLKRIEKLLNQYANLLIENDFARFGQNGDLSINIGSRYNFVSKDNWKELLISVDKITTSEYLLGQDEINP